MHSGRARWQPALVASVTIALEARIPDTSSLGIVKTLRGVSGSDAVTERDAAVERLDADTFNLDPSLEVVPAVDARFGIAWEAGSEHEEHVAEVVVEDAGVKLAVRGGGCGQPGIRPSFGPWPHPCARGAGLLPSLADAGHALAGAPVAPERRNVDAVRSARPGRRESAWWGRAGRRAPWPRCSRAGIKARLRWPGEKPTLSLKNLRENRHRKSRDRDLDWSMDR